jgi:ATP-dependent RNA helicase RhlE
MLALRKKMAFSDLGLSAPLLQAIREQKYTNPYPVQEQAIPAILSGKDILGISRTGTGKTAGYVLPILELFQTREGKGDRYAGALVVVPTRELAIQVNDVFRTFARHLPQTIKSTAVYGGVSINPQMIAIRGTDVLIATPGRLLDLIEAKAVHISRADILVLDEADKMLHMGFKEEMDKILALLPEKRQNILFSATLSNDINDIQLQLLNDPIKIEVMAEESRIDQITQVAYNVTLERKGPFLRYLIKSENMEQVLVFSSAIRSADNLVGKLNKNGIQAAAFHGDLAQGTRMENLMRFKNGHLRVLVATDLAARGIDIRSLPVVINFELPRSPKDYVHRIGRTGRADAMGRAITFLCEDDQHHFKTIQKKMGKQVEIKESAEIDLQGF